MSYSIGAIRKKRMQMYRKCLLLKGLEKNTQLIDEVTWKDVENVPDWLVFEDKELDKLINICGAIFLLPNIKLWIETSRLTAIKQLLGDKIFNELINAEINHTKVVVNQIEDVGEFVKLSGMSVLKSSICKNYKDLLKDWEVNESHKLDINLAKTFVDLSLMLINKYR
jgi:hypothetical protein